jgi:hypothetical protein
MEPRIVHEARGPRIEDKVMRDARQNLGIYPSSPRLDLRRGLLDWGKGVGMELVFHGFTSAPDVPNLLCTVSKLCC